MYVELKSENVLKVVTLILRGFFSSSFKSCYNWTTT